VTVEQRVGLEDFVDVAGGHQLPVRALFQLRNVLFVLQHPKNSGRLAVLHQSTSIAAPSGIGVRRRTVLSSRWLPPSPHRGGPGLAPSVGKKPWRNNVTK